MTLFWIVGKAGRDAVVASDLRAVGADLEKSESIVEIDRERYTPPFAYNCIAVPPSMPLQLHLNGSVFIMTSPDVVDVIEKIPRRTESPLPFRLLLTSLVPLGTHGAVQSEGRETSSARSLTRDRHRYSRVVQDGIEKFGGARQSVSLGISTTGVAHHSSHLQPSSTILLKYGTVDVPRVRIQAP